MSKIKIMENGNICYHVNEKNFVTITLLFEITSLTINGTYYPNGPTMDEHSDMDMALHKYIKDGDDNIETLMGKLTEKAQQWIDKHGLYGTILNHTIVRPNEWVDFHILSAELMFKDVDMSNNNLAKLKDIKMYERVSKKHGNGTLFTLNVDLVL